MRFAAAIVCALIASSARADAIKYTAPPSSVNNSGASTKALTAPSFTATGGYFKATKVSAPTAGTFGLCTGTLTAATAYYYRVSATNAVGESTAFTEAAKTTGSTGATRGVSVVWTAPTGATGYKVYGRTTGAEQLIATITSAATLSYCDAGSVSPSGALPSANTTGTSTIDGPLVVNGSVTASGADVSVTAPITGDGSSGSPLGCTSATTATGGCLTSGAQIVPGAKTLDATWTTLALTTTTTDTYDIGATSHAYRYLYLSQGITDGGGTVRWNYDGSTGDANVHLNGSGGTAAFKLHDSNAGDAVVATISKAGAIAGASLATTAANSTAITFHACSAATAFDAPSTTLGCNCSTGITVTGAALGDATSIGLSADMSGTNGTYSAVVTGANTMEACFCTAGTTINPASVNVTVCATRG